MNNVEKNKQIITALATPYGKSAVAVIRMSGDGCIELAEKFLVKKISHGQIKYNVFRNGEFKENLMAAAFVEPNSFTGQDTVELYPHGNMTVCENIIKALTEGGARLAERGEFTKRAFLNGKLDLMQCEALADIIDAQTGEQLIYGNKRYDGGFTELKTAESLLKTALSTVEAVLHYSDELEENETDERLMHDVRTAVDGCIKILEKEKRGFAGGKIVNDGFKVVLIGAPNVGKSTLLNALIGSDRAIVTPIAGTTRDTVEGSYVYGGQKFVITDTAGLNDVTADEVEKIGISRAKTAAVEADAVVIVQTREQKTEIDISEFAETVIIVNKSDETPDVGKDYMKAEKDGKIEISAKNGINIIALKQKLLDLCPKDYGSVCNHRQYGCILCSLDSIYEAKKELQTAEGLEIVAALLYEAYSAIAELHGEKADEQVISAVFDRFCVGK